MDRITRQHIAALYDRGLQRFYVSGKLMGDPVYPAAAAIIAGNPLPLLDIGCGIGLLGQYLSVRGYSQPYLGLDHDARKIDTARRAAQRAGLDTTMTFRHTDVAELPHRQGHVALLDVLHYLTADSQTTLLQSAIRQLAPKGCLIIRNVLHEPGWRFLATRLEEFFLHASGWLTHGAQHYPIAADVLGPLQQAGLEVTIEPLHGRTPFNCYLIVARRLR